MYSVTKTKETKEKKPTVLRVDRLIQSYKDAGYNQTEFAIAINDSQQHVSAWEHGQYDPGAEALAEIGRVLKPITIDYLLGVTDDPHGKIEVTEQTTLDDFLDRGLTLDEEAKFLEYLARRRKGKN